MAILSVDVNPRELRVPPTRLTGADPYKLARQLARFGSSTAGMPPIEATRVKDDLLVIDDGVTRATRVASECPGQLVRVLILEDVPDLDMSHLPTIGDLLP